MATKRQNQIRKLLDVVHGNGFEKIEFFDREQRKSRRCSDNWQKKKHHMFIYVYVYLKFWSH